MFSEPVFSNSSRDSDSQRTIRSSYGQAGRYFEQPAWTKSLEFLFERLMAR